MCKRKFLVFMSLLLALVVIPLGIDQPAAQVTALIQDLDPTSPGYGYYIPDYFTTPNWANSPPLAKFVDPLPGLGDAGLPIARPDVVTYPGSDYYEIELEQYSQKMHQDLPATGTKLRGYVQVNRGTDTSGCTPPPAPPAIPPAGSCTASSPTLAPAPIRYLGPVIIAKKGTPVRIKFTNNLPGGNLFLPVDTTIMGSGPFDINYDPETKASITPNRTGTFTQNRATLHLHGGRTPWISDGTAHQWTASKNETTPYPKGVSVAYVPDMWFVNGTVVPNTVGQTTPPVSGATNNPGPGSLTFFWTNEQSARFMFYHDHAYGITRLNVYAGEAAGYLINDAALEDTLASLGVPGTIGSTPATTDLAHLVPLVIQDKTFVDAATILTTDPTWAWGTNPGKPVTTTPVTGDLWWPHVYMPAQNPFTLSGMNDFGRWHYGPWFFPPTPLCASAGGLDPEAVKPYCIDFEPVPNPYCQPNPPSLGSWQDWYYYGLVSWDCSLTPSQPPYMPASPNPSWGAEAFLDTMVVNGAAYPTLTVDPVPYRFRILSAGDDRFLNLQWYKAVNKTGPTTPGAGVPIFTGPASDLTEVAMVPAAATPGFPPTWPTDGREGGVPDPATRGPAWIQIGTEGGVLPAPVVLPNQPVQWNMDPTMFNVGNVLQQADGGGTLFLGPAERADVIVDFTNFAGQTLILYNDAPTAFPALVPQYDYYTGAPDRTDIGGYGPILPGVGPNIRTVMQIVVNTTGATPRACVNPDCVDDYDPAILTALQNAFATTVNPNTGAIVPGIFASSQDPIVVGQTAYNSAYNYPFPGTAPYWGLSNIFSTALNYDTVLKDPLGNITFQRIGDNESATKMQPKAIHDEMGATFDDYGRMAAKLGLEVATVNAANQNFILQNFVDPVTEIVKPDEVQIWKITHNGVDTHPIHFHLFDVQLINRVGWDGFIRLPDPNELGWKDTVRISPLEDTIVALRPVRPPVPFELPNSIRPLDPTMPLGDTTGFSQINITDGADLVPALTNQLVNFGEEFTWHCHILGHEENDMMRATILAVPPKVPVLSATSTGSGNNRRMILSWTDNSLNETSFTVLRSTDPNALDPWPTLITLPPNTVTYSDRIGSTVYYYKVFASNTVGGPAPYPIVSADSGFSNVVPPVTLQSPARPTNVIATSILRNSVWLTWSDNATNETNFTVQRATNNSFSSNLVSFTAPAFPSTGTTNPFEVTGLNANTRYYFRVNAVNAAGASQWSPTVFYTTKR